MPRASAGPPCPRRLQRHYRARLWPGHHRWVLPLSQRCCCTCSQLCCCTCCRLTRSQPCCCTAHVGRGPRPDAAAPAVPLPACSAGLCNLPPQRRVRASPLRTAADTSALPTFDLRGPCCMALSMVWVGCRKLATGFCCSTRLDRRVWLLRTLCPLQPAQPRRHSGPRAEQGAVAAAGRSQHGRAGGLPHLELRWLRPSPCSGIWHLGSASRGRA